MPEVENRSDQQPFGMPHAGLQLPLEAATISHDALLCLAQRQARGWRGAAVNHETP